MILRPFILTLSFLTAAVSCQTLPTSNHLTSSDKIPVIEGITFPSAPRKIYVPLHEVADQLGLSVKHDVSHNTVQIEEMELSNKAFRLLTDGTKLITLTKLSDTGISVGQDETSRSPILSRKRKQLSVHVGVKRVEVSLGEQRLRAWQGDRLVLVCRISSGRHGRTPSGKFRAGPYKARRHYSSLYNNAPMPWSVQVTGHIFIHGFTSVPSYPASHGCIRLPLNEGNPAKLFYEWIDKGTPIVITKG